MSLLAKKPEKNGRVAVIDGDPLVYRVGFANEKKIYKKDGEEFEGAKAVKEAYPDADIKEWEIEVRPAPDNHLFNSIHLVMQAILDQTESDDYVLYIGGKDNFRENVATTHKYKGTRDGLHKPHHYQNARDFLVSAYGAIVVDGIEADDAVSIHHLSLPDSVLCTIDKDMDMIEGWHYNYAKAQMYYVDEETALRNFYAQMLSGDVSDNIVGIRGIGKKKAHKLLSEAETEREMIDVIVPYYVNEFGPEAEARWTENAQLLWMLREHEGWWETCPYTKERFAEYE